MRLSDIIFYNRGRGSHDGNNYWKKYRIPHYIYIVIMLVLMGIGIGLVSLFVCSAYMGNNGWEMFFSYLHEPLILLLNVLPCILLVLLFYFATGRAWAAFTFPALIVYVLSLINYYKIQIRSEEFLPADLSLVGEAAGIISNYKLELTGRVWLIILSFIFGVLFAVFLMRGVLRHKKARIIGTAEVLLMCIILYAAVYISPTVYNYGAVNKTAEINQWSELQTFVSKGFLYPFLNKVPDAFPTAPDGYSEKNAAQLLSEYPDGEIEEEKKVNVIAVMLEAYTDLSEHEEVPVYEDVYAPLHALQEESVYGHLVSNTFAGGTINSERNFLTGYTQSEDYRVATNSYVYFLRSQGYYAEGFHAGDNWFYNRENVEKYLGFENYYFLQDFEDSNRTDTFFFSKLTELYENRDKDTPYFNFSITYQNHGAYYSTHTVDAAYLDGTGLSETTYNILNNYLAGVADTTQRIYDFIDSLRDSDVPVVVVFFGDHMPWLGDGNSVYNELGLNINVGTDEGFYNYYSTTYLIWANDAAKAATGGTFKGDGGDISACFLMDKLFTECGWGKSGYMQINHELSEIANVVNTGTGYYSVNGVLTTSPQGAAAELVTDAERVEYYMKHNFMYSDIYRGS